MNWGRNGAILLGVAVLVLIAGGAVAKAGEGMPGGKPVIRNSAASQTIRQRQPQNDLAATELLATFTDDPTEGTATMLLLATCKNLGSQPYPPGLRRLQIQRKQGNRWVTLQGKILPGLLPGQTFTLSALIPMNDPNSYRAVVTQGEMADENPGNDRFMLTALPVLLPR